ncbi:efflux RND transporter permease subunit [Candidatus Paracaedibacter symbiosus]|uniref:efflux RND transporter permease subunit n=1 Tax=Candidatus Paracaedibacter symbiosus TaxID=244582 RepID=UPI000509AF8C|nr:efflux RND transporter permease subunit [Candidatus Paracaedibacter symbiosus]
MNLTTYFINHPVTSVILNGMIALIGALCFHLLSVREYPTITFPTITVRAIYPNASAELVETAVTNILEDNLAGVAGLDSITSSSNQGSCFVEMHFEIGTSMDQAMISVRDAVGLARGQLPQQVKDPVIERKTKSDGPPFIVIALESTAMDFGALTHFANLNLRNTFRSLKGVASCEVWGQPYTYKVSLDPKRLYSFGVNVDEIFNAISRSSLSLPVGKFQNETPATLNADLKTVTDYENILIREKDFNNVHKKQHPIFLKSVANISLTTNDEQFRVRINGKPGLCLAINKTSDANPLDISSLVQSQIKELQQNLPPELKVHIITDQTDFVRASLKNIQSSIIEAIIFVLAIVFLFLRSIRATLIPLVTIPISLVGSLLFLTLFGFSINIITLLAMVLAVGLVVDDAIVVLENISRHIEAGTPPLEAAIKGAREIGFAIVAMTLTLTSVYAPIAFIEGAIGQLFIEFAVALAGSVLISGIVALTLSPLMCATILKPQQHHFLPQIDYFFDRLIETYSTILTFILKRQKVVLSATAAAIGASFLLANLLPREMAPKEDRALIGVYVPPIPGKNITAMEQKLIPIETMIKSTPEAAGYLSFMGDWGGSVVLHLKPKAERHRSAAEIVDSFRREASATPSTDVWPWSWDSGLPGLDNDFGGGELAIVVSTTDTYRDLFKNVETARKKIEDTKLFDSVRHDLKLDFLSYTIDLDTNALSKLNLTQQQIAKTIEVFFSGDQSLTFSKDGILYPVSLEGSSNPWTLNELYVTNPSSQRISLGSVATMLPDTQPKELKHFNQMRSTTLNVDLPVGIKIESAMPKLLKSLTENLPQSYKKSWIGAAKMYNESTSTMTILFLLAVVFIFAILAIQFENFVDPLVVLLTVPLACSGALGVVWAVEQSMNIYVQVGLITLVGLITKHGILIVEFTNQLRTQGIPLIDAVRQAAKLRLRPILMTSGAMIFGIIPLVLSNDAGSESRRAIGAVLLGGLSLGTLFTLFLLPTLCYVIKSLVEKQPSTWEEK